MTTTLTITTTTPVIQEPARKESYVTESSLLALTAGRPIVVSYGHTNTGWNETGEAMKRILGEENVWNYTLGQRSIPYIDPTTGQTALDEFGSVVTQSFDQSSSSGTRVLKIPTPEAGPEGVDGATTRGTIKARRQCKAGLINAVFHNYYMSKNNIDDFVPIIFSTSLSYVKGGIKTVEKNSRTTCSEIEVLRKLCTDTDLPEDFRAMARQSVKFIDVQAARIVDEHTWNSTEFTRKTTYSFGEVAAPWEVDGYSEERARVKATWLGNNSDFQRPEGSKGSGPNAFKWKQEILEYVDPAMGLIPDPDEIEGETTTVETPVEVVPEFSTSTPAAQEEPTSSIPVTQETQTVSVTEG